MLYTAATCSLYIYSVSVRHFRRRGSLSKTLKTGWAEKADEAYSSALSWIYRKQKPVEKRADDEARWGSMLIVLAGKNEGRKKADNACWAWVCVCESVCTLLFKQHTCGVRIESNSTEMIIVNATWSEEGKNNEDNQGQTSEKDCWSQQLFSSSINMPDFDCQIFLTNTKKTKNDSSPIYNTLEIWKNMCDQLLSSTCIFILSDNVVIIKE